MPRADTARNYSQRLARVVAHIDANLEGRLELADLAAIACFSPYHFHRLYRDAMGETVAETVSRLRLHRAALALLGTSRPTVAIARRAGYASAAAFGRAFAARYGVTPAVFRNRRSPGRRPRAAYRDGDSTMPVVIQDRAPMRIAYLPHVGPYNEIGRAFERLYAWAGPRGLAGPHARGVAIFLDDVRAVPAAQLRSEAGITIAEGVEGDGEVRVRTVPGGRHAMLLHKGPYAGLFAAMGELYGWLPQSGEEPGDAPQFEVYLNDPHSAAPADLLTEICLPLKG